jgi:uncharacterized membrane protein
VAPDRSDRSALADRALIVFVVALGLALAAGLFVLWPEGDEDLHAEALARGDLVGAVVVEVDPGGCETFGGDDDLVECIRVSFRLEEGPEEGSTVTIEVADVAPIPDLREGDRVVLERLLTEVPGMPYALYDRDRTSSLAWLALLFAGLVVLLGRLRGFMALIGLGLSFALLLWFVLPAILEGRSPVLVACVGAGAIAYVVIYLAHGISLQTTVAVLGTLAGVTLAALLSLVWVPFAQLTGLGTETAYVIQATGVQVDPGGLLLAGIVIGALGAIDDVSVTQASAVWEIHDADRSLDGPALFRSGMRVGRDHVGSIVNTLALAYVGASLPLLIVFQLSDLPLTRVLGGEIVATEIVRTLVGSIGLVASMPVTTWFAARVAARAPASARGGHAHGGHGVVRPS